MAENNKTIVGVLADQKTRLEEELADARSIIEKQEVALTEASIDYWIDQQEIIRLGLENAYLLTAAADLAVCINELKASNQRLNESLDKWE